MRTRNETRQIRVGGLLQGGGAPVTVQSMCNTKTWDVEATVAQIKAFRSAGCDIVRLAVPTSARRRRSPPSRSRWTCPWSRISILITGSP